MSTRNARIGLRLFLIYLLFYGAYVLTNAFAPDTMEATPFAGVNMAVISGLALIVLALLLALVYGFMASNAESTTPASAEGEQ